jgi:ThiJ/PfpI family-like
MATLLMPLPDSDFDPTESGVPWRTMRDHGHNVVFATPAGRMARADSKMVTGEGLGILSPLLKADANGRSAYLYMEQSERSGDRSLMERLERLTSDHAASFALGKQEAVSR